MEDLSDKVRKEYDTITKEMNTALSANPSPGAARKTAGISSTNNIFENSEIVKKKTQNLHPIVLRIIILARGYPSVLRLVILYPFLIEKSRKR